MITPNPASSEMQSPHLQAPGRALFQESNRSSVPAPTPPANPGPQAHANAKNVGDGERKFSVAAGSIMALLGVGRGTLPGLLIAGVGGALIARGVTGQCQLYSALNIDTSNGGNDQTVEATQKALDEKGIEVQQAMLIDRSPEDLYKFWHQFQNLPTFMHHLKSVEVLDAKRSHWVTQAPSIAGGSIEWDAEITRDEPNAAIAWRSLPGSQIDTMGEIRFTKALGDRGTEVHVLMKYLPPAGKVGHWIATLFGDAPSRQMRDDLRSFKSLMEVGEVPSIEGQPRGNCVGK